VGESAAASRRGGGLTKELSTDRSSELHRFNPNLDLAFFAPYSTSSRRSRSRPSESTWKPFHPRNGLTIEMALSNGLS
jgi:hypothetical protein